MKSKLFTCLAMLLLSFSLMAQTKSVSGTVVDGVGPVAGASVIEKGTQNGAVTDLDGKWTLRVPQGAVVVVSSIGYKDVEIVVGSQNVYNVTLEEDRELLDEVVVITKKGQKHNGTLLYTIRPIQEAVEYRYQQQLAHLEAEMYRQKALARIEKLYGDQGSKSKQEKA